jgi:hypothetical protein
MYFFMPFSSRKTNVPRKSSAPILIVMLLLATVIIGYFGKNYLWEFLGKLKTQVTQTVTTTSTSTIIKETSVSLTTTNPPSPETAKGWTPPTGWEEIYTLSGPLPLDLKIAKIETGVPLLPPSSCPARPQFVLPCPTGQVLTAKKDSCGDYAACETPATPSPSSCVPQPARPPLTVASCGSGQVIANKSGTDNCGTYFYQVCEAPVCQVPQSVSTCPSGQSIVTRFMTCNSQTYAYTVCETSAVPPATPTTGPTPTSSGQPHSAAKITYCFDDAISLMSDSDWALICEAKARGIISGTAKDGKTYFNPNTSINRAETSKIVTLGILKSLGKLSADQFTSMDEVLKKTSRPGAPILFTDIEYDAVGGAPWFAKYVSLANREGIMTGYPDKTFKPSNTLNNVEAYKIIIETGRSASKTIDNFLEEGAKKSARAKEWFVKYVKTLELLSIPTSPDYSAAISRKDFLRIVMEVLMAAGL